MLKFLFRLLDIGKGVAERDKFDPIYGLPQRSLTEWLSRNPALSEEYNAKLAARSLVTGQTRLWKLA